MSLASRVISKISKLTESNKGDYAIRQVAAKMIADRIAQGTGLKFLKTGTDCTFSCVHSKDANQDMMFKRLRSFRISKDGEDESFRYYIHNPSGTMFIFVCNTQGEVIELRIEFSEWAFEDLQGYDVEDEAMTGIVRLFGHNFL